MIQLSMIELFAATAVSAMSMAPAIITKETTGMSVHRDEIGDDLLSEIRYAANRMQSGDEDPFDAWTDPLDTSLQTFRTRENAYEASILIQDMMLHPAMTPHEARGVVSRGCDAAGIEMIASAARSAKEGRNA